MSEWKREKDTQARGINPATERLISALMRRDIDDMELNEREAIPTDLVSYLLAKPETSCNQAVTEINKKIKKLCIEQRKTPRRIGRRKGKLYLLRVWIKE